jgi:hypothetical protein
MLRQGLWGAALAGLMLGLVGLSPSDAEAGRRRRCCRPVVRCCQPAPCASTACATNACAPAAAVTTGGESGSYETPPPPPTEPQQ